MIICEVSQETYIKKKEDKEREIASIAINVLKFVLWRLTYAMELSLSVQTVQPVLMLVTI